MYKYVSLGKGSFIRELWEVPKNCNFVKPSGGIWASKYTPDEEYISSWQRFCKCENFSTGKMDKAVMFNLKSDSKICTIDSFNDLKTLMHKYKDNNTLLPFLAVLDFEMISKDYDVIELTEKGQRETRYFHPENLRGWDIECILILNFDVIGEQKELIIEKKD